MAKGVRTIGRKRGQLPVRVTHGFEDHAPEKKRTPEDEFMQTARDRFQLAADADEKQRKRELDDIRFYNGDQWPEDVQLARKGQTALGNLPPIPARPCLTINETLQPVALILNQERAMDMGGELVPADDFEELVGPIDDAEIELRENMIRRIQRAPETADARSWAFERAAIAGRGYWGVMVRDVPGKTWDQEVYVHRFFNQSCVSLDPFHEQPDGSDAEWGFVGADVPWDVYKVEFPKDAKDKDNDILHYSDEDFRALGEEYPGWFTEDGGKKLCRVVDYYYTVRESRTLCLMPDNSAAWKDELPDGSPEPIDTREVVDKRIKWAKLDGVKVLRETDWAGPDIPIIKVVGRELQPSDDDRRMEGIVRPMRDAGQGKNFMVSAGVERIMLSPLPPWMIAAGQDEGFSDEYVMSTTRPLAALHYNTHDANGVPYPSMPIRTNNGVDIAPVWSAVDLFQQAIRDTTLTPSAAIGEVDPSLKSGKAIQHIIQQSQKGTSNFLDNQARSIRREITIINNLLYPIYGQRPGRVARIMSGEGDTSTVLVNQPFMPAGPKGRPQPIPAQPGQPLPDGAKHYTLTKDARFNAVVKVSKSYDTRREQEAQILGDLIASNPAEMQIIGDMFFKSLDGPGHKEMAERHKLMLAPQIQQHIAAKEQGKTPPDPQMMAQMQQMQGIIQQLQQELLKANAGIPKAQIDAQSKIQQTQMNNDAKLAETSAKIASDERIAALENQIKLLIAGLGLDVQKAKVIAENDRTLMDAHAQGMDHQAAALDRMATHAHEAAMKAVDHAHQENQRQRIDTSINSAQNNFT